MQRLKGELGNCPSCQQNWNAPIKASLHLWEWSNVSDSVCAWITLAPTKGMFLILVDAYFKWMEVMPVGRR